MLKNLKIISSLIFLIYILSGCLKTFYWDHPNKTSAQFHQEKNICVVNAQKSFPPRITTGGGWTGGMDVNAIPRAHYFRSCLQGYGWVEKSRDMPLF